MKTLSVSIAPAPESADAPVVEVSLESLFVRLKELDGKKEEITQYFADLQSTLDAICEKANVNVADENYYFQLEDNDVVFEISKYKGKFTHAPNFDYKRTARDGEPSQGKLAKKTAKELGFVLEAK